jgi:ceramide glucosyltransferase
MGHLLLEIVEIIAGTLTVSSIAYYILCLWSAAAFRRGVRTALADYTPPVSILKPLKGTDPEMYESFRSHCLLDYPEYEVIFGVSDPRDPALELVDKLCKEFPARAIRTMVCGENLGTNIKVSNLAQMARAARHEYLVVNDSDIRVEPDYLRRVIAPLADPQVGLVTCLYRGVPNETFGSRLESLGISTDFCTGVLVARQLEGICFGLGSTLAFRRKDLQAIGGFESLADYLADDYQLGRRIADKGLKVELPDVVVETFLPRYSLSDFFSHQLRWARTIRDSRFWGYVGLGVTFGIPWALLTLIAARGAEWALGLLAVTLVARLAMAVFVGRSVLKDRFVSEGLVLVPVRDVIALLVWMASFAGHTVKWRGKRFKLKKGKLEYV